MHPTCVSNVSLGRVQADRSGAARVPRQSLLAGNPTRGYTSPERGRCDPAAVRAGVVMNIGFHVSIQGGLDSAVERAEKLGCSCLQIFTRSPRSMKAGELEKRQVIQFKRRLKQARLSPLVVHLNYLPNLASPDRAFRKLSAEVLAEETLRCSALGAQFLVFHPGSRRGSTERRAIRAVAHAINRALAENAGRMPMLLVENTSGQGHCLGADFSQLAAIIDLVEDKRRVGVCLDTAHVFQAGYDVSSSEGLDGMLREISGTVGLRKIKLLHLNDSKSPCGSRLDRHWHIGRGRIGKKGFSLILHHPALRKLPGILETPKKRPGDDARNMRMMKHLLSGRVGKN